jgi:hypothetical protein
MMSKQTDVLYHYLSGKTLTTVKCRELFHTTELRRINSRLNHMFRIAHGKEIIGEFLRHDGIMDDFKTYRLVKIEPQQKLAL